MLYIFEFIIFLFSRVITEITDFMKLNEIAKQVKYYSKQSFLLLLIVYSNSCGVDSLSKNEYIKKKLIL